MAPRTRFASHTAVPRLAPPARFAAPTPLAALPKFVPGISPICAPQRALARVVACVGWATAERGAGTGSVGGIEGRPIVYWSF